MRQYALWSLFPVHLICCRSFCHGSHLHPIQKEEGYDPAFKIAAATNIASAKSRSSDSANQAHYRYIPRLQAEYLFPHCLWQAGYVPGLLMGLGSMVCSFLYAKTLSINSRLSIHADCSKGYSGGSYSLLLIIIVVAVL